MNSTSSCLYKHPEQKCEQTSAFSTYGVHCSQPARLFHQASPEGNVPPLLCHHAQNTHIMWVWQCLYLFTSPSIALPCPECSYKGLNLRMYLLLQPFRALVVAITGDMRLRRASTKPHLSFGKPTPYPACSGDANLDIVYLQHAHVLQTTPACGSALPVQPSYWVSHPGNKAFIALRAPFGGAGLLPGGRGCARRWPGSVQTAPGRTQRSA